MRSWKDRLGNLPCTEAASKCAVQSSSAALVGHGLLPYWHKSAVVAIFFGKLGAE